MARHVFMAQKNKKFYVLCLTKYLKKGYFYRTV